ncbi:MAG: amidase [Actinobacteria bacterium]|nr:amidase [Actinomycetota bacterium]
MSESTTLGWTANAISEEVRSGRRTAVDAVTDSLARIREYDDDVAAFQVVRRERALAEAADVDARPDRSTLALAGVPVAIKDNVPVAGEPMRVGSAATDDSPQSSDHVVVERIRGAGGVVVGLTRVPELCVFGATDSVHGITRNPWDLARTPGGSSGGSAAAVAAGMVPVAHGNDGMGSVRIPAACCGLVGIKPGLGVVPAHLGATDWYSLSENGALATTAEDAALLLSVMAGDASLAGIAPLDERLHVAVSFRAPVAGVAVDPAWAAAADRLGSLLRGEGHDVRHAEPVSPTDAAGNAAAIAGLARWFAGTAADADELESSRLEPRVRRHAMLGRLVRRTPLMDERLREAWIRHAERFLREYDVLITPALAQPPINARRWFSGGWSSTMLANIRYAPFAAPWNVAGMPAIVIPMGVHPQAGTPVAAQVVARRGREALLLSIAAWVERARPWRRTAPGFPD